MFMNRLLLIFLAFFYLSSLSAQICIPDFNFDKTDFLTVEFQNNSLVDDLDHYYWEFGDGTSFHGKEAVHVYPAPGLYIATLYIKSSTALCSELSKEIIIKDPNILDCQISTVVEVDTLNPSHFYVTVSNDANNCDELAIINNYVGPNSGSEYFMESDSSITAYIDDGPNSRITLIPRVQIKSNDPSNAILKENFKGIDVNRGTKFNYNEFTPNFEVEIVHYYTGVLLTLTAMYDFGDFYHWGVHTGDKVYTVDNGDFEGKPTEQIFIPYSENDMWLVGVEVDRPGDDAISVKNILIRKPSDIAPFQTINCFTFPNGINGWESKSLNPGGLTWEHTGNGKADSSLFWGDREPIQSSSMGDGAACINLKGGDDTVFPSQPHRSYLESPIIDCSNTPIVWVQWYEYFRAFVGTKTEVQISGNGGLTWDTIEVNKNLNSNVETSTGNFQQLDISKYAGGKGSVKMRFYIEGYHYFWIIDDVCFVNDQVYPDTKPKTIKEKLIQFGYPYDVDPSDAAIVKDQLIINWESGISDTEKQEVRDSFGIVCYENCFGSSNEICNDLELWILNDSCIQGNDVLSEFGLTIDIHDIKKGAKARPKVKEVDFNPFAFTALDKTNSGAIEDLIEPLNNDEPDSNTIAIVVIDTGVDMNHFSGWIYRNENEMGSDEDGNCYKADFHGINFDGKNNNPLDINGHGTHITGVITQTLEKYIEKYPAKLKCTFKIVPIKSIGDDGVGTLYNVLCGMQYALNMDKVKIINASLGFYGEGGSEILKIMLQEAAIDKETLVVAAVGNESTRLTNDIRIFPACYNFNNVLGVASYDPNCSDGILPSFTNDGNICVEIAAPGMDVESYEVGVEGGMIKKSGTSISTAYVSAVAAIVKCLYPFKTPQEIKEAIFDCAYTNSIQDTSSIVDGRVLDIEKLDCLFDESATRPEFSKGDQILFPNPIVDSQNHVFLEFHEELTIGTTSNVYIRISNLQGQVLFSQRINKSVKVGEKFCLNVSHLPASTYLITVLDLEKAYIRSHILVKTDS